jgi:hypothetical protein
MHQRGSSRVRRLSFVRCTLPLGVCLALLACAQPRTAVLETIPAPPDSRSHVPDGVDVDYGTPFPTAGLHSLVPAQPGFYAEPQPLPRLVHALEHGNIVIYYDAPGEEALQRLKSWSEEFNGDWDGILVVPDPSLDEAVVLTAWEHRQMLDRFDDAAVGAFIDAYRGRGPEQKVR